MQRLEAIFLRDPDDLFLHAVQIFVDDVEKQGRKALFVVQLCVVHVVDRAVHDKIHERGHDGLAPLGEQKLFQAVVAERRIFDIDLADDADFHLLLAAPFHLFEPFEKGAGDLFIAAVPFLVERIENDLHAVLARLVGRACLHFIGLALVIQGHERIPVKNSEREFGQRFEVDGEAAVLFQSRKVQGYDGNVRKFRFERLPYERNVVGRAAAAARLGDHDGGMLHVIFAAFEGVDELSRHAERGIAGVVMDVFEPFVDDGAGVVVQKFEIPAVLIEYFDDDVEMHGKHIRNEDLVGMLHLFGEFRVVLAEICDVFLSFSFHFSASFAPRSRRACCAGVSSRRLSC